MADNNPVDEREARIDFVEFPARSSEDLARSRDFFSAVFGWQYQMWGDDYADTRHSGVGSGINADSSHRPGQPLVVIYSADLKGTRSRVIGAGGRITRDVFSFPGGRRFHFADPAGNELAVWSDR